MFAESLLRRWGELISDPSFRDKSSEERHRRLMDEIRKDPDAFISLHRLTISQFDVLTNLIEDDLQGLPLSPAFSLSLALRYLCSGWIIRLPSEVLGVDMSDLPPIMDTVYEALVKILKPELFAKLSMEEVGNVIKEFDEMWNFPNCYGAVEYRRILCEPRSPIENIKYVTAIGAVSDAYCRFSRICTITLPPTKEDGYPYLSLRRRDYASRGYMSRLPEEILDGTDYVTVGSLHSDLVFRNMRPYEMPLEDEQQSIFNNRLERAKSVVDNAFGILFKRWGIFQSPLPIERGRLWRIVQCTILLHNYLINKDLEPGTVERNYLPEGLFVDKDEHNQLVPGSWAEFSITAGVKPLENLSRWDSRKGEVIRSKYALQFTSEGKDGTASTRKPGTDHDENEQPATAEK